MIAMLKAIAERCSVRKYKLDPVPEEALQEVLDAALHAPSANNARPWHIVVVTDEAKRQALAKTHEWASFADEAPVILVFCAEEERSPHWWIEDCSAAVENAMIQAVELGLGSCWIGVRGGGDLPARHEQHVRGILGIPAGIRVLCLVTLGYPQPPFQLKPPGPMENVHREAW